MLPSELADELKTTPSAISKQLKVYFKETGRTRESRLDDTTVQDMRTIHDFLQDGKAQSFRQALHKLLGLVAEPVPADSAQLLNERMEALEEGIRSLEGKLDQLAQEVRTLLRANTRPAPAPAPAAVPTNVTPPPPPHGS